MDMAANDAMIGRAPMWRMVIEVLPIIGRTDETVVFVEPYVGSHSNWYCMCTTYYNIEERLGIRIQN